MGSWHSKAERIWYDVISSDLESLARNLDGATSADLEYEKNIGQTALNIAASKGSTDMVNMLICAGANVNYQSSESSFTALMWASSLGHIATAQALLRAKADVNAKNQNGITALMLASVDGHKSTVQVLLEAAADRNIQDKEGNTALIKASRQGHTSTVRILWAVTDVNMQNKIGWTALMGACMEGRIGVVQELLQAADIDLSIQNQEGETALFVAARQGHAPIVQALLEASADVHARNKDGQTVFAVAKTSEIAKIISHSKSAPQPNNGSVHV